MDSKLEEKELDAIGDFLSAAITKAIRPDSQFANPESQGETRCEALSVTSGNDATATLALQKDGLWLTLKTPRGSATFNLEFKLDYHDTRKSSICERVAVDYFKRIK